MTLPAAGWFPDPRDAQRLRWWDGRTWGSATQPAPRSVRTDMTSGTTEVAAAPQFSISATKVVDVAWACGSGVGTVAAAGVGGFAVGQVGPATEERRFCLFGWTSLAVALVSAVVNPLGMFSVLAIVLAVAGFVRPRGTGAWRVVGRSFAASAVVIAVTTGIVFASAFAALLRSATGL
ncbi:DUF2510 domain-containing protein [Curtobacterium sp. RRHDQ10]|uniref:DUF2510 domain-containing protein n=1 Tax=Curtobacterium phyllosphaerae TaxID=3413379 RepID=UPI003BEFFC8D